MVPKLLESKRFWGISFETLGLGRGGVSSGRKAVFPQVVMQEGCFGSWKSFWELCQHDSSVLRAIVMHQSYNGDHHVIRIARTKAMHGAVIVL
eukprot:3394832-Amphidinium_carterae.1